MDQKLTFTAYLKDEYSKKFEHLAEVSDDAVKDIVKDLDKLGNTGKKVTRNIETLEKRIAVLGKVKKLSINVDTVRAAEAEIKKLQQEIDNIHGPAAGKSGGGGWLGGMGRGFAIGGGLYAAGALIKSTAENSVDATAKYQKYEAVLANMFGNQGTANKEMEKLARFAANTPNQVDEITASFVKLNGNGFNPTIKNLTQLGDLAASKGKGFDQLTEALIDAEVGEFERLKEFGIKAKTVGDKVTFTFNQQNTTVDKTAGAIRNYILGLGDAVGISGSMAAISKTTGGMISNLEDNFDLLYKTIGDRFKPEIDSTIISLSNMVVTVKGWFEIPLSEKLKKETDLLSDLRTELGFSNTSEERRKEILEQVKRIQPDIIDNTKSEKEQLDLLNSSLDDYIGKRRKQIALEQNKELNLSSVTAFENANSEIRAANASAITGVAMARSLGLNTDGMSPGQAQMAAIKFLEERIKSGNETNKQLRQQTGSGLGVGGYEYYTSEERTALGIIKTQISRSAKAANVAKKNMEAYRNYLRTNKQIEDLTGGPEDDSQKDNQPKSSSGSGSGSSQTSISGGAKVTHLNISIGSLINGGMTIQAASIKESPAQIKDIVTQTLLTAVNDVNLTATN